MSYSAYSNIVSGTPTNWWLAGGVSSVNCLGAYSPIGKDTLANSLINLNNPGTNNLTVGTAPSFSADNGWTFDPALHQYFKTGIVPTNDTTVIVAFDNSYVWLISVLIGAYQPTGGKIFLIKNIQQAIYNNGAAATSSAPWEKDAVLAMAGSTIYRNDVVEGTVTVGAALPTIEMYIGALNQNGAGTQWFNGNITGVAIYDSVLTDEQVFAIMANIPRSLYYKFRKRYTDMGLGAFIGYNMSVFGDNSIPASMNSWNPTDLDTDEWIETCVAAGMKYAVFYAKSEDGFCNYPSQFIYPNGTEPYSILSTPWYASNNRDPVAEFIASCRKYGIKPLLYYPLKDLCYAAVSGSNYDTDWDSYWTMLQSQLTEVLQYDIDGIWFDLWSLTVGYVRLPYATLYSFVKGIKPNIWLINNGHEWPSKVSEITTRERPGVADVEMGANIKDLCEDLDSPRVDNNWWGTEPTGLATYKDIATMKARIAWINARNSSLSIVTVPATTGHLRPYNKQWLELLGS